MKSQSCINAVTSKMICRPSCQKPFLLSNKSGHENHGLFRCLKSKGLDKFVRCFNDLYVLEPILNLQGKVPAKGILKNTPNMINGDTSLNENDPSVKDFKFNLANRTGLGYPNRSVSTLEKLTVSIQELHISTQSQSDHCGREFSQATGQPSWSFGPNNHFVNYASHNNVSVNNNTQGLINPLHTGAAKKSPQVESKNGTDRNLNL